MQIDAADVQLLFAHMQPSLVKESSTENPERIRRAAVVLMKAASTLDMPTTFALVPKGDSVPRPIDELTASAVSENSFVQNTVSPFLDPAFRTRVLGLGRRILIVCGITTDGVVLHSSLDALELGLRVFVPIDAVGCRSPRGEQAALRQLERAGGEQISTTMLLSMLAPDFSQAPGSKMLSLIDELEA